MNQKTILPPLLALLGGAVGFALRKWQLAAGFESDTGLAIPGAPSALVLIGWSALMTVLFLVLVQPMKGQVPTELSAGFGNQVYLTATLLGAVMLLVSAGGEAVSVMVGGKTALATADTALSRVAGTILPPLRVLLCAGGVFAAGIWARKVYRGGGEDQAESLALLELPFLFCVWLISEYQLRAADPVVMDYVYGVLAITADALALYYLAGYSFGDFHPRRCVFFALLGTCLSLVALADSHTLAEYFRLGFAVVFLTTHVWLILNSRLFPAGEKTTPTPDTQTETEADENG